MYATFVAKPSLSFAGLFPRGGGLSIFGGRAGICWWGRVVDFDGFYCYSHVWKYEVCGCLWEGTVGQGSCPAEVVMKDVERFWNLLMETMPREQLEKLQLRRFRETMRWAIDSSPFYRRRYEEAGVAPEDIGSLEDVSRVPMISKDDMRMAQEEGVHHLYGGLLGVPSSEVTTFHQTAGTTGRPLYVPDTFASWQDLVEVWCYVLYSMGFRNTDRVYIPFNYGVYIAFWLGHYAAEKIGCEVVPGGGADTRARISKMIEVRATAVMNTPTYGLHMAEAAREMGIDLARDLHVEKMLCAGEPMPEPTRLELERQWGADVLDHVGAAEVGGWGYMCTEKRGLHVLESCYLLEVVDLETLSRPVSPGGRGVAVVTALGRRSFPCIRYNLKDVVTLSDRECNCGRTFKLVESISGRTDHLTKIRGVLFSPVSVEEVVRDKFPQVAEFETVVSRPRIQDELVVRVELHETPGPQELRDFQARLGMELKLKTNLNFEVELVPPQTLPRYELKSARFKDTRTG